VGIPGRVVGQREPTRDLLEHGNLPDPVAEAIRRLLDEQDTLKARLVRVEKAVDIEVISDKRQSDEEDEVLLKFGEGGGG
jgi:serine O-acetyltransferase